MEGEEDIPPILKGEVETAIKHLKNNRVPGEEGIINECLKWGQEELADIMTGRFNKIVETEAIPEQWHTGTIIRLLVTTISITTDHSVYYQPYMKYL
jgi:hypothetical protein